MGRPAKLSNAARQEIKRRLLAGEKASHLAREFGVSKVTIGRVSKPVEAVRSVVNDLVSAEVKLRELPVQDQLIALSLADELRAISMHLASAAKFGAATADRLSGIAHGEVKKINDANALNEKSMESLRNVATLTRMANESSVIGLNLLAANREMVKKAGDEAASVLPVRVFVRVEDASRSDAHAEQATG